MSKEGKGASTRRFGRRRIAAIVISILVILTLVEVYAHTYVRINSLSPVTEDQVTSFENYTGTYTFSRSGCRWVVGWIRPLPQFGYVDIFKLEQNASFFIPQTDLVILGLVPTLNNTGKLAAHLNETYYTSYFVDLRITYDASETDTGQIDFGLKLGIYQQTLLGIIPQGDITVPINATVQNPSSSMIQGNNSSSNTQCPILYTYDGTNYQSEGLLGIHNPAGVDKTAIHTLTTMPADVDGVYEFKLVEHPQTISHINQVRLFAILQDGGIVDLPLVYAWHSEYGNVLPQLLFADEWRVLEIGANHNNGVSQSIQLKFLALPPGVKVSSFIFQIEGYNPISKG